MCLPGKGGNLRRMGEKNDAMLKYLEDDHRFANLLNGSAAFTERTGCFPCIPSAFTMAYSHGTVRLP